MKMKLRAALAVVLVYGHGTHNPHLSEADAATLRRARKLVAKAARHVMKVNRPALSAERRAELMASASETLKSLTAVQPQMSAKMQAEWDRQVAALKDKQSAGRSS